MKIKQKIRCFDCKFCDAKNLRCRPESIVIEDHDITKEQLRNYRKKDCDGYISK